MAAAMTAFAADPFLGSWKLKPGESKFPGREAPRAMTVTWTVDGDSVRVATNGINASGEPFRSEYTARYDGKETQRKGPWNWDAVVNRQVSEREREDVFKREGKVEGRSRLVVSEDGKRMTVDFDYGGVRSVRVFERVQ